MWLKRENPSSGTLARCPWCGAEDAIRLGTIVHSYADGKREWCVPEGSLLHCIKGGCGCDYKSLKAGVVVVSQKVDPESHPQRRPNEPANVTPVMRKSTA